QGWFLPRNQEPVVSVTVTHRDPGEARSVARNDDGSLSNDARSFAFVRACLISAVFAGAVVHMHAGPRTSDWSTTPFSPRKDRALTTASSALSKVASSLISV